MDSTTLEAAGLFLSAGGREVLISPSPGSLECGACQHSAVTDDWH